MTANELVKITSDALAITGPPEWDSPDDSELAKTVIGFSEQFTRKAQVDEEIMVRLKEELGDEHLVKLAAAVGQANWTTCSYVS